MPKLQIKFKPIDEPYMHGVYAQNGNLVAEVVRVRDNDWCCFFIRDDHIVVIGANSPYIRDTTKADAMRQARAYLRGELDLSHRHLAKEPMKRYPKKE